MTVTPFIWYAVPVALKVEAATTAPVASRAVVPAARLLNVRVDPMNVIEPEKVEVEARNTPPIKTLLVNVLEDVNVLPSVEGRLAK